MLNRWNLSESVAYHMRCSFFSFTFLASCELFVLFELLLISIRRLWLAEAWFNWDSLYAGMEETVVGAGGVTELSSKQRHQMKHRELFLSRQVETMPATHIRGKCCVTLLNETESLLSYLNKEDSFFYCLVFDPAQRTLLADKGIYRRSRSVSPYTFLCALKFW